MRVVCVSLFTRQCICQHVHVSEYMVTFVCKVVFTLSVCLCVTMLSACELFVSE